MQPTTARLIAGLRARERDYVGCYAGIRHCPERTLYARATRAVRQAQGRALASALGVSVGELVGE